MKVHTKFLSQSFIKSLFFVSFITLSLVFILNILTELDFFKEINIETNFLLFLSLLNSPSMLFEIFPFILLIATQIFFIKLFSNNEIEVFKYSGLKNSKIILILLCTSFTIGILLATLFYNLSSNLKNIYLELKNTYTADDKYLAVITNNGLWIKDNIAESVNIINASKIDDRFLVNASITELDKNFNVSRHIQSEKIDISETNWVIYNPSIYIGNDKKIEILMRGQRGKDLG